MPAILFIVEKGHEDILVSLNLIIKSLDVKLARV